MTRFCKNIVYLVVAGMLAAFASTTRTLSAEQSFFSAIDDLPVMPPLIEDADAAISFESSAGRVAEVQATGIVSKDAVNSYYKESLPQLGWHSQANGSYRRGNELLVVEIKAGLGGTARVLFHIKPAPP